MKKINVIQITGHTDNGRAACGHRVKKNEVYYIAHSGPDILALCKNCVQKKKILIIKKVRIPEDLNPETNAIDI